MKHKCIEHLRFRESDSVETHGLDCGPYEHFHEEWHECAKCGERFTEKELAELEREQEYEAKVDAAREEHYAACYSEEIPW